MPGALCVRLWLTLVITTLLVSAASAQSSSGTSVPPAPNIVDNSGGTWTVGSGLEILRNGVHAGGGWGAQILWLDGVIYVRGTDANWYRWTGSMWTLFGSSAPVGTVAPSASVSGECAATWTVSSNQWILRNGEATGGLGSQIVCAQSVVYALGGDNNWWRWTGSSWAFSGSTMPAGA